MKWILKLENDPVCLSVRRVIRMAGVTGHNLHLIGWWRPMVVCSLDTTIHWKLRWLNFCLLNFTGLPAGFISSSV